MAIQVQIRRGTNKENNTFTGAQGEVTVNTINNSLRIHDGETVGGHIVLSESQITNCITEIPQDINLELNNGTLTLKAGSKVHVPNGDGVFDTVTTTQDLSITITSNGRYLIYKNPGNYINYQSITTSVSGATDSMSGTPWHLWYDTTNNVINRYGADGTTAVPGQSLPIAVVTVSNGAISSIDQVFNGFGYIGSTRFALPGIKWLSPDNRNPDETLKSIQRTNTNVLVETLSNGTVNNIVMVLGTGSIWTSGKYIESETEPSGSYIVWYKPSENILRVKAEGNWDINNNVVIYGYYDAVSSQITSFRTKQPFQAVNYNDVVRTNSDQTIDGTKTFTTPIGVKQTSGQRLIICKDTNNVDIGSLEAVDNSNDNYTELFAFDENGSNSAQIGIHYNNGSPYGFAPTPTSVYDNSTKIATTAHIVAVLDKIYPIGALYIGTTSTCPLAAFFGTWVLVEYGDVLQTGNGTVGNWSLVNTSNTGAWNIVAPSLPNVNNAGMSRIWSPGSPTAWGAFSIEDSNYVGAGAWDSNVYPHSYTLSMNLSSGNSYYSNTDARQPVQPRALVVNVWRRTA